MASEETNWKEKVLNFLPKEQNEATLFSLELRMAFFAAALNSYKVDSLLKPFPPDFVRENDEKQFDDLRRLTHEIPTFCQLNSNTALPQIGWKLLHWILTNGSIELQLVPVASFDGVSFTEESQQKKRNLLDEKVNYRPSLIFKVHSTPKARFLEAKAKYGSIKAFHGSKVENFHSILQNGLINCLNKRDLFGSGTYLSSELSVAIEFSPFGLNWPNSTLGHNLSCIAVCDLVNHPDIRPKPSFGLESAPNAYYVVKNDDWISLSHILVYANRPPSTAQVSDGRRRRFALLFVPVLVTLIAVSLLDSITMKRLVRKLSELITWSD